MAAFENIRTRQLIPVGLLSALIAIATGLLAAHLTDVHFNIWVGIVFYGILFFWVISLHTSAGLRSNDLMGPNPNVKQIVLAVALVPFLILTSYSTIWLMLYPLSFYVPDTVDTLMKFVTETGDEWAYQAGEWGNNIGLFLLVVVAAPVVEELVFRGILLRRWAIKWGLGTSVLATSVLFGLMHTNFIGAAIIGVVMATLYLSTRSLVLPIIAHMANNLLALEMGNPESIIPYESLTRFPESAEAMQASLSQGLLVIIIGMPPILYYIFRNRRYLVTYSSWIKGQNPEF